VREFFQRHHKTVWTILVILAVVVVVFWGLGLREGAIGTGVHWRHS
jgi:hypothetical protein